MGAVLNEYQQIRFIYSCVMYDSPHPDSDNYLISQVILISMPKRLKSKTCGKGKYSVSILRELRCHGCGALCANLASLRDHQMFCEKVAELHEPHRNPFGISEGLMSFRIECSAKSVRNDAILRRDRIAERSG